MEVENRYITVKDYTNGQPSESNFELKTSMMSLAIPDGSKSFIVKNLYLSVDPYQINRMKKSSSSQKTGGFATQLVPGKVSQLTISTYKDVGGLMFD